MKRSGRMAIIACVLALCLAVGCTGNGGASSLGEEGYLELATATVELINGVSIIAQATEETTGERITFFGEFDGEDLQNEYDTIAACLLVGQVMGFGDVLVFTTSEGALNSIHLVDGVAGSLSSSSGTYAEVTVDSDHSRAIYEDLLLNLSETKFFSERID